VSGLRRDYDARNGAKQRFAARTHLMVLGRRTCRRRGPMATLTDLPPHVWALVLRGATVHTVHCVAHTCRALHQLVTSSARCTCACPSDDEGHEDGARTRAFWAHMRPARWQLPFDTWCAWVRSGHVAHVALALRCGVNPGRGDQSAIAMACTVGHLAMVTLLLRDARVDPSANVHLALQRASYFGHVEIVERLLRDTRVDPSARCQEALRDAVSNGHYATVELLLRDERVARDMRSLYECIVLARRHKRDRVAVFLDEFCTRRARTLPGGK